MSLPGCPRLHLFICRFSFFLLFLFSASLSLKESVPVSLLLFWVPPNAILTSSNTQAYSISSFLILLTVILFAIFLCRFYLFFSLFLSFFSPFHSLSLFSSLSLALQ